MIVRAAAALLLALTGGYVALRPLWVRTPLTPSRWLDALIALALLLRAWQNVRTLRRNSGWPGAARGRNV